jgi:hypothetical protein
MQIFILQGGRIGKNTHYVNDREPPLLVMPGAADSFFLKDDKVVFRLNERSFVNRQPILSLYSTP